MQDKYENIVAVKKPVPIIQRLKNATLYELENNIVIHLPINPQSDLPESVCHGFYRYAKTKIHSWAIEDSAPFEMPFFTKKIEKDLKIQSNSIISLAITLKNYNTLFRYVKSKWPNEDLLPIPQKWTQELANQIKTLPSYTNLNSNTESFPAPKKTPVSAVSRLLKANYKIDLNHDCYIISISINPIIELPRNVIAVLSHHRLEIEKWLKKRNDSVTTSFNKFFYTAHTQDNDRDDIVQIAVSLSNYSILYDYLSCKGEARGQKFEGPTPVNRPTEKVVFGQEDQWSSLAESTSTNQEVKIQYLCNRFMKFQEIIETLPPPLIASTIHTSLTPTLSSPHSFQNSFKNLSFFQFTDKKKIDAEKQEQQSDNMMMNDCHN